MLLAPDGRRDSEYDIIHAFAADVFIEFSRFSLDIVLFRAFAYFIRIRLCWKLTAYAISNYAFI